MLWLSPIYPSGGADAGYDVTDYRAVDRTFGDLASFDRLVAQAHERGLRIVLDFVANHTSDRHPWFVDASASRSGRFRDFYIWAPGRDDGPPNNWRAGFGGSAWVWHEPTGEFYLASFYPEQPDLNWRNRQVRQEVTDAMVAWVDRGVDGFRLDVIHKLAKDPLLRDNPEGRNLYDENRPEVHDYVRQIRTAVGRETFLLGEVWLLELEEVFRYLGPQELDEAFNFSFATGPWQARAIAAAIERADRGSPEEAWPCYHLSNHDESRAASRHGARAVRAAAVLLLTLRGTPVLYQGEEIGMTDGEVPPGRRRDRAGRDPQRTPMQWDDSPNAGFCPADATPWLPLARGYEATNIRAQTHDDDSVLSLYRRLLALRRESPALHAGRYRPLAVTDAALAYARESDEESFVVAINFSTEPARVHLPPGTVEVATSLEREGERLGDSWLLRGGEAVVVRSDEPASSPLTGAEATSDGAERRGPDGEQLRRDVEHYIDEDFGEDLEA